MFIKRSFLILVSLFFLLTGSPSYADEAIKNMLMGIANSVVEDAIQKSQQHPQNSNPPIDDEILRYAPNREIPTPPIPEENNRFVINDPPVDRRISRNLCFPPICIGMTISDILATNVQLVSGAKEWKKRQEASIVLLDIRRRDCLL